MGRKYNLFDRDRLFDFFNEKGLESFETRMDYASLLKEGIVIQSEKDFFRLIQLKKIDAIYWGYYFSDFEEYLVDGREIPMHHGEIKEFIDSEVQKQFDKVKNFDFSSPIVLVIYFPLEGFSHVLQIDNEIYDELLTSEDFILDLEVKIGDRFGEKGLNESKVALQTEKENKIRSLKMFLMEDPEFQRSTNLNLRRAYSGKFVSKYPEKIEVLREVGYSPYILIEEAWKEYRELKRQEKENNK